MNGVPVLRHPPGPPPTLVCLSYVPPSPDKSHQGRAESEDANDITRALFGEAQRWAWTE